MYPAVYILFYKFKVDIALENICPVTGKRYTIGDTVKVKVIGTDILKGNIDFEFVK